MSFGIIKTVTRDLSSVLDLGLIFTASLGSRASTKVELHASFSESHRPPDIECVLENYVLYFSSKTYVLGTQKNCLNETVLLST